MSKVSSDSFKSSLEKSMAKQGLLSQTGDYTLTAELQKLSQPLFGIAMEVTAAVNYQLNKIGTAQSILNEVVTTPYTAKFSDALVAVKRLRLANEGAIRENINAFLTRLSKVDQKIRLSSIETLGTNK
jgi:hypothetical protein